MEENNSLFSLTIDPVTKSHLMESARWGKFLAIIGFILCVLMVVMGIFFGTFMSRLYSRDAYPGMSDGGNAVTAAMVFLYLIIAVINFFPCLFLFRFATGMKAALNGNDQNTLNTSFQNLKALLRYVGIITIIVLVIYGLGIVFVLLGTAMR